MNLAYKRVRSNKGACCVDGMDTTGLLCYLRYHKDSLVASIESGNYSPNPVRRVEIPKENGQKRQLGIPTVVDRVIQQAISQVLSPIYEKEFHPFIETKLFLKVNRDKTKTSLVRNIKFLGYSFYFRKGHVLLCAHPRSVIKLKDKLRTITQRRCVGGYKCVKQRLKHCITGWINYFSMASMNGLT